jgi:PadR family transcriptional regulator PadR
MPVTNAKIIDIMSWDGELGRLGEVEQLVLLAIVRLNGAAYAVPIRALLKTAGGVDLTRGSVYVTLDRLEEKGLVASAFSAPTGGRGGKARRVFRIRPAGTAALRAVHRTLDCLRAGTAFARPRD